MSPMSCSPRNGSQIALRHPSKRPELSYATKKLDVGSVSRRVGYESSSQFSREYIRFFGTPPVREISKARLRTDDWDPIRCREVTSAYTCPDESRRSRSMLNGYSVQLASRKAPPLAENTEKSRGALIPRAPAIVTANNRSNTPLNRAAVRVCHPNSSRKPRMVSAQVATMARAVIVPFGKNQLSCRV